LHTIGFDPGMMIDDDDDDVSRASIILLDGTGMDEETTGSPLGTFLDNSNSNSLLKAIGNSDW
jgi:hypothetical protein